MKNLFILLMIALPFTISISAYGQGVWGVEAGVNFANIKGDDIPDEIENRSGLLLGVFYQYRLGNSPIVLQPELLYSQKGFEFGSERVIKLNYVVASGLAAYFFERSEQFTPFVKAGPYAGFNITSKQEFNETEEDLEGVNDLDAGIIIRAGVQLQRFEAGARFSRGLTEIFDGENSKHSIFGFYLGVEL